MSIDEKDRIDVIFGTSIMPEFSYKLIGDWPPLPWYKMAYYRFIWWIHSIFCKEEPIEDEENA